jgi:SAM-dependent methyltransferase
MIGPKKLKSAVRHLRAEVGRRSAPRPMNLTPFGDRVEAGAGVRCFVEAMAGRPEPDVLELGSLRSVPERSTLHTDWVPHARTFRGTDVKAGADVDIVADVHRLTEVVEPESLDGVISCSSFEHFKYPWIAATEIARVLKPGGLVFVQTHQTYGLHAYPHDFWRFTTSSMRALFPPQMNLETLICHYEFPCLVLSREDRQQHRHATFLNVCIVARKTGPTPDHFIPEL